MLEFFFQFISKWPTWLSQSLHPFSDILNFFSDIRATIIAPPSDDSRRRE